MFFGTPVVCTCSRLCILAHGISEPADSAAQIAAGPARKRVGLLAQGRAPVREGAKLQDSGGRTVGHVTSGGFGPSLEAPVAMGYVEAGLAAIGTSLNAVVRGRLLPMSVARMPFVEQRYYRG